LVRVPGVESAERKSWPAADKRERNRWSKMLSWSYVENK